MLQLLAYRAVIRTGLLEWEVLSPAIADSLRISTVTVIFLGVLSLLPILVGHPDWCRHTQWRHGVTASCIEQHQRKKCFF